MAKKITVLLVAMPQSVHTARWINQLVGSGLDVHLFPSWVGDLHPSIRDVTVHEMLLAPPEDKSRNIRIGGRGLRWPFRRGGWRFRRLAAAHLSRLASNQSQWAQRLCCVIREVEPDIVHTLETQAAGYLTLQARKQFGPSPFPKWVLTPWGSDLNLFGRLQAHHARVREVLSNIDFYCPKADRDIRLAQEYGFTGHYLPLIPGNGGIEVEAARRYWQGPPSGRKLILLKGYQNWAGRALFGLRAMRLISDILHGYTIAIYAAQEDVRIASEIFSLDTGVPILIVPECPHNAMLAFYGRARLSLGISISDGVPNSMLEAMTCGAFPIESEGSCASEWIEHGKTGMIVAPENTDMIAKSLRIALTDDGLVDRAAELNVAVAKCRIDVKVIGPKAIQLYREVMNAS